jgi:hypothetical protein
MKIHRKNLTGTDPPPRLHPERLHLGGIGKISMGRERLISVGKALWAYAGRGVWHREVKLPAANCIDDPRGNPVVE